MDKKQFAEFAMALKTYYPREQLLPNTQAMELWYRELQDIPMEVAEIALRKWVSTNKWSPSIAEIREMAASVTKGELPDWGKGWEQVQRAFRLYGRDRKSEALASFDPITRQAVEYLGWVELCNSTDAMADRANFRMCFETVMKREKTNQQMALPLLEAIEKVKLLSQSDNGMFRLGGGDNA